MCFFSSFSSSLTQNLQSNVITKISKQYFPHYPGETGIGKSTLMDTLFNTNFENFESSHFEPKVKLRAQTYDLQESNVRLKLTIVNTVGFGDQMNKQERWEKCSHDIWVVFIRHQT